MLRNTTSKYGLITKALHWLIFIIIVIQITLGLSFESLSRANFYTAMFWHKSFGLLLFFVAIIFVLWRIFNPKPAWPSSMKAWEKALAYSVQTILYLLLLATPLSGWIMSTAAGYSPSFFGLFTLPCPWVVTNALLAANMNTLHHTLIWVLCAFAGIHIIGALKHQFLDKDDVLKKML